MSRPEIGIKGLLYAIPDEVSRPLFKAILFFICWALLYHLVLEPNDFPDKQLIDMLVAGTQASLMPFFEAVSVAGDTIQISGRPVLTVFKECNGLDFIVIFSGFLLSVYKWSIRLLASLVAGMVLIFVINIARCAGLAILFYSDFQPHSFTHHQIFTLFSYGVIFGLWMMFDKKVFTHAEVHRTK